METPGNSGKQRSLECYSPWGCRVRHDVVTEQKQQQNQVLKKTQKRKNALDDVDEIQRKHHKGHRKLSSSKIGEGNFS